MTLGGRVHLRSWLLEEVESQLKESQDSTVSWALNLLTSLWANITTQELILEAEYILPTIPFLRFLRFAARNYPVSHYSMPVCSMSFDCLSTTMRNEQEHVVEPINHVCSDWSQVQLQRLTSSHVLLGGAAGVRVGSVPPDHPEASAKTS